MRLTRIACPRKPSSVWTRTQIRVARDRSRIVSILVIFKIPSPPCCAGESAGVPSVALTREALAAGFRVRAHGGAGGVGVAGGDRRDDAIVLAANGLQYCAVSRRS